MKYQLGFIGCGNMGGALVTAAAKTVAGQTIAVCDYDHSKAENFAKQYGANAVTGMEIAENADFVVLGVKPQVMGKTLAPLASALCARENLTVVTMAAGVSIAAIRGYIGKDVPVIRIMPNTPVALGAGMILYTTADVSAETEQAFLQAFSQAGVFDKIPEDKIDAGSALSGCGPAFVYAFAEALADGGVECGIPRDKAALYAAQTLLGAAQMLLEFGHPADLKDAVCSPGGTTIAGIHALEAAGFRGAAMGAVTTAYKRTLELKK
ncbi:MAG: pyrroline-5-carboxylate reductase [Clostridiales bacterium]|nr:pyrroline-5-carboxylate reductase [Clostridiales bacterium]